MAEAQYVQAGCVVDWVADASYDAGDVVQIRDGRAGVLTTHCAAGDTVGVRVDGIHRIAKTTSMVMLVGSQLFFDHSARKAHLLFGNDRDFYLGCVHGGATPGSDAASNDTTVLVDLNRKPVDTLSLADGFASIPVSTAGWPHIYGAGDSVGFKFDLTAEAQKLDALSIRGLDPESLAIVDALICVNLNGDDAAFDLNVGLANGTHASDADQITESLFMHMDGASLNINFESADGTTHVNAADSTVDAVVGTPFLVQFDCRNTADIQVYVNGVNVLPSSVFRLDNATGPLKLLAHMEKSSNDSPGNVTVMRLAARPAQV